MAEVVVSITTKNEKRIVFEIVPPDDGRARSMLIKLEGPHREVYIPMNEWQEIVDIFEKR